MRIAGIVLLIILSAPLAGGQQWSGILSSSRATDWSTVGVTGGIPSGSWTQCGGTIAAYTGTGAIIQAAINACTANHFVQLGAGTFTLSTGFSLKTGVVVRGMGADTTVMVINDVTAGGNCGYTGVGAPAVALCAGSSTPQSTASWTAGYAVGTTRITLTGSLGSIGVGTLIQLIQNDETDGYPAVGYSFSCDAATNCSNQGQDSPGGVGQPGKNGTWQLVRVTNVVGGGQFDITPPITMPNVRSGQSPSVIFNTGINDIISNAGVENFSIDYSGVSSGPPTGIGMINARDCWITGMRTIYAGSAINQSIWILNTLNATVRNNYIYNQLFVPVNSYPIYIAGIDHLLLENNICQGPSCDIIVNGPMANSVQSYNFFPGLHGPGLLYHSAAQMMNLFEGNVTMGWGADITHGTSQFNTVFRNAMIGRRYGPTEVAIGNSVYDLAHNRMANIVGNVMGDTHYNTYEDDPSGGVSNNDAIYTLGGPGNNSGAPQTADARVKATMMRWGNWDKVTNATRWCGNSSDTGWSTTCSSTSEVPTGITFFSNPVPATETLPASFYYSAKPVWWPATKPWPPTGPDVTGGNIASMAGHANTNPAADCYLTTMGGASDGSGGPYSFNSTTCYSSTPTSPTVTTTAATSVTNVSAVSGGNVTSDGGASVTSRGVCRSTSPNPTTSDTCTSNGTGTGVFTSNLNSPPLVHSTTYNIRAFATNSSGTGYGTNLTFTTAPCNGVTINPTDNAQTLVTANPAGTTFCFQPGANRLTNITAPKAGDNFFTPNNLTTDGAVLNGSTPLTGWTSVVIGPTTYWMVAGGAPLSFSFGPAQCQSGFPGCYLPQDLYLDNVALIQDTTLPTVLGHWYYDFTNTAGHGANQIYVLNAQVPNSHTMELGHFHNAIVGNVQNITIKGLIVEKYAPVLQDGAISAGSGANSIGSGTASGWVIQNTEVRLNHAGIDMNKGADSFLVTNTNIHNDGTMSFESAGALNGTFSNSTIAFGNQMRESCQFECVEKVVGASDCSVVTGLTFTNNNIHDNLGGGLWDDGCARGNIYTGNVFTNNDSSGIRFEISEGESLNSNTFTNNGSCAAGTCALSSEGLQAIVCAECSSLTVSNNTIVFNNIVNGAGAFEVTHTSTRDSQHTPWTVPVGMSFLHNNITIPSGSTQQVVALKDSSPGAVTPWMVTGLVNQTCYTVPSLPWTNTNWVTTTFGTPPTRNVVNFTNWQAAGEDLAGALTATGTCSTNGGAILNGVKVSGVVIQ